MGSDRIIAYLFTLSACPGKVFCVSKLDPPDVKTTPK